MQKLSNKFLDELASEGKSDHTIVAYRTALNQFEKWFANTTGEETVDKVTPLDLKEFRQYLVVTLKRKPATVNKALVILKSFFSWASDQGYIESNPAGKVKLVKQQKQAPKWLNRNEQNKLKRIVQQTKNDFKRSRDMAIVALMMFAGLRVEEVANLELASVKISDRKGFVIVSRGKGHKYREVTLNAEARKAIAEYLKHRAEHRFADSEFLIVGSRSPHMTTRGIQYLIERYGQRAGIEGLTAHQLRHTFGHELVAAEVSLNIVAQLMGHESLDTTRIYTTPGERELQSAVEKISAEE